MGELINMLNRGRQFAAVHVRRLGSGSYQVSLRRLRGKDWIVGTYRMRGQAIGVAFAHAEDRKLPLIDHQISPTTL